MNTNKATETNEKIRNKIIKAHNKGMSWYMIGLYSNTNECTIRKFAKGVPVSKAIMNRLEEWSKNNE